MPTITYGLYIKTPPQRWSIASDGVLAGSVGRYAMTDAFQVSGIREPTLFRIHVADHGWLAWTPQGNYSSGIGHRLEAIEFQFPAGNPKGLVFAREHLEGIGWRPGQPVTTGTVFGTTGQSRRLEAIQMVYYTEERASVDFERLALVSSELWSLDTALATQATSPKDAVSRLVDGPAKLKANISQALVSNSITVDTAGALSSPSVCLAALMDKAVTSEEMRLFGVSRNSTE